MNFLTAIISFYSISRAIKVAEASTWLVPMIWISIFAISLFLTAILVKNILAAEIVIAASLMTSLIFALDLIHLAIVVACIFMILSGVFAIRRDLDLNVKISLWKSLYMGKFGIIFAVAILISSQYFFTIKNIEGAVNVPKFDVSEVAGPLIAPILGIVNPEFAQASSQNLTIDEFIIQTQKENQQNLFQGEDLNSLNLIEQNIPQNISEPQRSAIKQRALEEMKQTSDKVLEQNQQLVLQEGRRQFSKIAGKKIEGSEKVSEVFVGMINSKINNYFQPVGGEQKRSEFYPLILSLILFLTIWPLGSLLSALWFSIVILLFKIFVKLKLVEIGKVMVEREMIG